MIAIPSILNLPGSRVYGDTADAQIRYVDLLKPSPAKGNSATRWMPIAGNGAYLVGEVRFGPGREGFGDLPKMGSDLRLLPMPWEICPVFAWYREGDGVQVVARGKTSGFGPSNAVFAGTASLSAMASPVLISAELVCNATMMGVHLSGEGNAKYVEESLAKAALGERAAWDTTLWDVLAHTLSEWLDIGCIAIKVRGAQQEREMPLALLAELRESLMMEWAHRIQVLMAPELTLAAPAALVKSTDLLAPLPINVAWTPGRLISLRAVRMLRPNKWEGSVSNP